MKNALNCKLLVCALLAAGCTLDAESGVGSVERESNAAPPGLVNKVRNLASVNDVGPLAPAPAIRSELVELGRVLAFDKILSGNENISCMTCHHPTLGTGDARSLSVGEGAIGLGTHRVHPSGAFIPRNAPPMFNLHVLDTMFWDGRVHAHAGGVDTPAGELITPDMAAVFEFGAASAQAMFPVTSNDEMLGHPGSNDLADLPPGDLQGIWAGLMARLGTFPEYVAMFEVAYPGTAFDEMSFAHAANAIAAFEIVELAATDTPWDRFLTGDDDALTQSQLKGAERFFGDAGCAGCHTGDAFTDEQFHNTGLSQFGPGKGNGITGHDDFGRLNVSGMGADLYAFRTAPLRNVAISGPWGHSGQFTDLTAFVQHYQDPEAALLAWDVTQIESALQATVLDNVAGVLSTLDPDTDGKLNPSWTADVVAFLDALTDPSSLDLLHTIPATVPSGLPVSDDPLPDVD